MAAADPVFFQDKGVFQSNVYEVIRAHSSLANRFLAAEKQLASLNPGDGSEFSDLKASVKDLSDSVKTVSDDLHSLKTKVDTLFPDEGTTPPTENTESQPADPSAPAGDSAGGTSGTTGTDGASGSAPSAPAETPAS